MCARRTRDAIHCIHPCTLGEALFHPHPWASGVALLDGEYLMPIGFGPGDHAPPIAATMHLTRGSRFAMTHRDGWHAVAPILRPASTVMLTTKPWGRWSPSSDRPLGALPPARAREHSPHLLHGLWAA